MAYAVRTEPGFRPVLFAAGILLAACRPTAPPVPQRVDAAVVYQALVEAGCLAPDDGGLAAVVEESQSDAEPSWLACLFDGGTVQSCGVPCQ